MAEPFFFVHFSPFCLGMETENAVCSHTEVSEMRRVKMILSVILLSLLTGCGGASAFDVSGYAIADSGAWNDGTYTEEANGKNGTFSVTVVIEDGKLSEIRIGDNQETPDRGGVAIENLPDTIIEEQSVSVEAVSGATVTSDAIKEAVAKCLEAAS